MSSLFITLGIPRYSQFLNNEDDIQVALAGCAISLDSHQLALELRIHCKPRSLMVLRRLNGMRCLPSGNQTWRNGKWTIYQ